MRVAPEAVQDSLSEYKAGSFAAKHRLLRVDGFDRVVRASNISNRFFKIFFARNDRVNARLGIISSKKIMSRSVDRNHTKRFIRETFRQHGIKTCRIDLVVMIRPAYVQTTDRETLSLAVLLSQVKTKCAEL